MKTIESKGVKHIIYEPHEEAQVPNKSTIKNAYSGCYVQSEEGYWVPVIKHNCSKQTVYLRLPRKQITSRTSKFSYIPERMNVDKIYLNPKQKAVAELILSGLTFPKAVRSVYLNYKKGIKAIIHCDNFFIYIGKSYMSLKDKLLEKGLDEEFLADKIKDILSEEKRQSPIIKLWALNKLADSLAETDKPNEVKQFERALNQNNFLNDVKQESTLQPRNLLAVVTSVEQSDPSDDFSDYELSDVIGGD